VFHWCSTVSESVGLNPFLLGKKLWTTIKVSAPPPLHPRPGSIIRGWSPTGIFPSTGDVGRRATAITFIPASTRAMIEAMRSELDVLREAARRSVTFRLAPASQM
jgi:hypothetical protein